jgi:hypothetical protein
MSNKATGFLYDAAEISACTGLCCGLGLKGARVLATKQKARSIDIERAFAYN